MPASLAHPIRCTAAVLAMVAALASVRAETLVFHASESGRQTLDGDDGTGNPFASALIEALGAPLLLSELPSKLHALTAARSRGFQTADVPKAVQQGSFAVVPARPGEQRIALVMVVAEYSASGARSLPGARQDADRIATALQRAGFRTERVLDPDLRAMRARLAEFSELSRRADAAVIYVTGHGVEVDGTIFLLPGDYPVAERRAALPGRALPLSEIARSPHARQINLVLYGGCRDNPFE